MTTTSSIKWLTEVLNADKNHYDPDVVYEFTNGRKFTGTDKLKSGIYGMQYLTGDDGSQLTGDDGSVLTADEV